MAERRVSVRLSVVGGNQTKAELAAVGADGQRSMERIAKATEPAGRGLRVVDAAAGQARQQIDQFASRAGAAGTVLRALGPIGTAAAAGIGGALYAHYLQFVSVEGFTLLFSIQFLGMIIIGGLGSLLGTLLGTAFMVLLPEVMQAFTDALAGTPIDSALGLRDSLAYLREITIGLAIILFLVFEPDGLAHRWRQIKAYWKLFPFSH